MKDVIGRVLDHYDLGELSGARRIGRGFINENWMLETTRGRYFLKRRHPDLRDPTLICAQHALNKHLQQSGFPAPAILSTTRGETLLVLDGEYFEIQEHIEGTPYQETNEAHFQAAAVTLGHYHACVHGFTPQPLCDLGELYSPQILGENLTNLTDLWHLDQDRNLAQAVAQLQSHTAALADHFSEHHELPCLVIHGDYHAENLLFQGDRIVGVVDYDKACWQPRAVELAEALIYFASPRPGHLKHLVYSGFFDWDKFTTFIRYYTYGISSDEMEPARLAWLPKLDSSRRNADSLKDVLLKEKEVCALPDYICCIWLTVSLEQLLEQDSCPAAVSEILREVLDLAVWSHENRQRIIATICALSEPTTDPSVEEHS